MSLFRQLFVFLLLCCLCTGCDRSKIRSVKEWTTFSPAGERFSVLMPIEPIPSTVMSDTRAGQLPVYFYTARPSKECAFIVTQNSFPSGVDLTDTERILDKIENQATKNGAQLISKEHITLHGISGREIVFEKEGQVLSLRCYLVGREAYEVFSVISKGSACQKLVPEFLDSFQLK